MEVFTSDKLYKSITGMDMDISDARYAILDSDWRADGIRSPFTRVYMIISGEAFISDEHESIKMTAGNIYVIPANHVFSYRCEKMCEKMYFHISLLTVGSFDALSVVGRLISIENAGDTVGNARRMFAGESISDALGIKSILYSVAEKSLRMCGSFVKDVQEYSELVKNAFVYIEKNLSSDLSVDVLADALFVSKSKLQKAFRAETGTSVGRYIDECLMMRAEKELRTGGKTIAQISEQLGFCDRFYFSRRFSQRYGLSPSRYRKKVCFLE